MLAKVLEIWTTAPLDPRKVTTQSSIKTNLLIHHTIERLVSLKHS